ncbi:hypothetical protein BD311DRAFT_258107 [Dichomitus squalens]|uniref:Uncharacterized protein n=1 Tax=Dichomitus squalens TaxID=114155 RepID=A0A4Q9MRF3_9APHY|nr:hypothetical protein BD311DRAFT_258107 [Dichomitus squalens]
MTIDTQGHNRCKPIILHIVSLFPGDGHLHFVVPSDAIDLGTSIYPTFCRTWARWASC